MSLLLKTDRLELKPFTPQDIRLFHRLNTDSYIRKYLWDDEILEEDKLIEILYQNERHFRKDKYGLWKIQLREKKEVMGFVGLWYFFSEPQPQLIYALLKKHTKKGYAREAGSSILTYVFKNLGLTYLTASMDESNIESQKVAEKLGMSFMEKRYENGKPTLFYKIEKNDDY